MDWATRVIGRKIVVYDGRKVELGEGQCLQWSRDAELGLTVYECREHTILAKHDHWVKVSGQLHKVEWNEQKG